MKNGVHNQQEHDQDQQDELSTHDLRDRHPLLPVVEVSAQPTAGQHPHRRRLRRRPGNVTEDITLCEI